MSSPRILLNRSIALSRQLLPAQVRRTMATAKTDVVAACNELGSGRYSVCDISDALLKLKVPQAGFLPDIVPIPPHSTHPTSPELFVAPISTMLFVPKASTPETPSNIPVDKHWSDMPEPGTIAVLQQPQSHICAMLGDIMATRLQLRKITGVIADGRIRDLNPISAIIASSRSSTSSSPFTVFSRGTSTVGTGLQSKPWLSNHPLIIGSLTVQAGDIMCADEKERGCVVIPQEKLGELMELLPGLKDADDAVVKAVEGGMSVGEAFAKFR